MIDPVTGIDFPFFQNQLLSMFGEPSARGTFAEEYLELMDFSEFASYFSHILDFQGNPWKLRIYGNFVMLEPLKKAFRAVCERGLAHELKTFDGCFNIRRMRGSGRLSVHSWALALDFNAATNPFTRGPLITDMSEALVRCFLEAGFEWGGLWRSVKDAMHYQLPWTTDWRRLSVPLKPVPYEAE